jgi:hypothetical protein
MHEDAEEEALWLVLRAVLREADNVTGVTGHTTVCAVSAKGWGGPREVARALPIFNDVIFRKEISEGHGSEVGHVRPDLVQIPLAHAWGNEATWY